MESTGIMAQVRELLASGKSSREVIEKGYAPGTVYKVQRSLRGKTVTGAFSQRKEGQKDSPIQKAMLFSRRAEDSSLEVAGSHGPPFRPVFEVTSKRESSVVKILNGRQTESRHPSVFLVEAGGSRTPRPREATRNLLQA